MYVTRTDNGTNRMLMPIFNDNLQFIFQSVGGAFGGKQDDNRHVLGPAVIAAKKLVISSRIKKRSYASPLYHVPFVLAKRIG